MRSKIAESSLVVWRGKRGFLLDFRSVKYFSPRCPYVRGPPDGELGTTYRVTCPINSFIFRLENKFPINTLIKYITTLVYKINLSIDLFLIGIKKTILVSIVCSAWDIIIIIRLYDP